MHKKQILKVITCFMNGEPICEKLDSKEYDLLRTAYEAVKDLNRKTPIMMKRPMLGYLTAEGIISPEEGAKLFGCTIGNAQTCRLEYTEIRWKKEQTNETKIKKITRNMPQQRCASGMVFFGKRDPERFWR